jgi:hypothetical protein
MQFENAKEQIRAMFPESTYIAYSFQYTVKNDGTTGTQAWVSAIPPWSGSASNLKSYTHAAPTWQGVIDALKIQLLPKGESSVTEMINEDAVLQQTTTGKPS